MSESRLHVLDDLVAEIQREIDAALEGSAEDILKWLEFEFVDQDILASRALLESLGVGRLERSGTLAAIEIGPFGDAERYAYYVEHGRHPGGRPKVEWIVQWMLDKGVLPNEGGTSDRDYKRAAYAIARWIGEEGVVDKRPMAKTIERHGDLVRATLERQIAEAVTRINGGA